MSDFRYDTGDFNDLYRSYAKQTEKELADMRDTIVRLRARITLLEDTLQKEREDREQIPLPKSVLAQIIELEKKARLLNEEVEYLKKYVPEEVLINRKDKDFTIPVRKGSGLR